MVENDLLDALAALMNGRTAEGLPPMTEQEKASAQTDTARIIGLYPFRQGLERREKRKSEIKNLGKEIIYCESLQMVDRVLKKLSDDAAMDLRMVYDHSASLGLTSEEVSATIRQACEYLLASNFYEFKKKRGKGKRSVKRRLPYRADQLRDLLSGAIDIFQKWSGQFPASTPESPGWVFLTEIAKAAGYRDIDMTRQIQDMLPILQLCDNDFDARFS